MKKVLNALPLLIALTSAIPAHADIFDDATNPPLIDLGDFKGKEITCKEVPHPIQFTGKDEQGNDCSLTLSYGVDDSRYPEFIFLAVDGGISWKKFSKTVIGLELSVAQQGGQVDSQRLEGMSTGMTLEADVKGLSNQVDPVSHVVYGYDVSSFKITKPAGFLRKAQTGVCKVISKQILKKPCEGITQ